MHEGSFFLTFLVPVQVPYIDDSKLSQDKSFCNILLKMYHSIVGEKQDSKNVLVEES